jgi:hypothetical protein
MSSDDGVTLGELHRQGREIKAAVRELDRKFDRANATLIRHAGRIEANTEAIAEIRAYLKSRRLTTTTLAGLVATVITVVGQVLGHIQ